MEIEKKTLDKILAELNITSEQILEEGFMDRMRRTKDNVVDATTGVANRARASVAGGINSVAGAVAPAPLATVDLKKSTFQALEQFKTLTTELEQNLAKKQVITEQDAIRFYQELNSFITKSIQTARTELMNQKAQGIAPAAPAAPVAAPTQATVQQPVAQNQDPRLANANLGQQDGGAASHTRNIPAPVGTPPAATNNFTYGTSNRSIQ